MYLQIVKGYYLISSSCKSDTVGIEFLLKHPYSGITAAVQVKQGGVALDDSLLGMADQIFLFTTEGKVNSTAESINVLTVDMMSSFILTYQSVMPDKIKIWLDIYSAINTQSLPRPAIA